MASVQKISPFLMFDGPVEEAAKFYVSVFPNSEIKSANPMSATIVANGTEIRTRGASPGRSSPTPSTVTSAILIARKPTASCRPCSR